MSKALVQIVLFFFMGFPIMAQEFPVSGKVSDNSGSSLPGAAVQFFTKDSTQLKGLMTDTGGVFSANLPNGQYLVKLTYISYTDKWFTINVNNAPVSLGKVVLRENSKTLKEVEVSTVQQRGEQKGDTTQFNSGAFKVHQDASAEDLVKKMPGVTTDANGLVVNGESVKKVLVDGQPFFGDDPNAAMKNLPADMIDKVQIFDQQSDQSRFTGFNDGNQQKTINLITKKDRGNGIFGKVYGGYGTNDRYNAGATINSFKGKRRVSLLLLSNNINQQNFSVSDIMGAMGNSGQSGGMGMGRMGGGGSGGSGGAGNFLTNQQNGITATQSAGLNYTDAWGKKINVSGSYFFNYTDNNNSSVIARNYFTENKLVYKQNSSTNTKNINHRVNFRFEYNIDSLNKLTITPSLVFQDNSSKSDITANNSVFDLLLSQSKNSSIAKNKGYDFSNNILYQHKFKKPRRTVSLNISTQWSDRKNDGSYNSYSIYSDSLASLIDQQYTTVGLTKKVSPNLTYTEPFGKYSQVMLSYNPSYTGSSSDKETNDRDTATHAYSDFNSALSNKYTNVNTVQRGGIAYRYQKGRLNISAGADAQQSLLDGKQIFPTEFSIQRSFNNILPNASLRYQTKKKRNLNIQYRTSTNIPSVSQLQGVLDVSNPLQVKSGNAGLNQTFENNLSLRFGGFNPASATNFFTFISVNNTSNYVSSSTTIFSKDTLVRGYLFKTGSQLTQPVNVDGYWNARAFAVYGFPLKAIKSNLNVNGGLNYSRTPSLINNKLNTSDNYAVNGGLFIGSNISKRLDFSLGYNLTYNTVLNSLQAQSNNTYMNHAVTFKANTILKERFVLNTDITYNAYTGLTQSFNQTYFLWNGYAGYKFLKDKSLEAKVSVFDILNQNKSISRTVNPSYTEDSYTSVLRQYFMFTLTYTFRSFKGKAPGEQENNNSNNMMQGMPPRGGMH